MRIGDEPLGNDSAVYEIKRGQRTIPITLTGLAHGQMEFFERRLPMPVLKRGQAEAEFQAARTTCANRRAFCGLAASLRLDPTIEIEAQEPAADARPAEWEAYADAIESEFGEAGLTTGELMGMAALLASVMRISTAAVEKSLASFT